ncbi:MAG: endonuclease/exonuclease/phosphatase family protein [Promethearchaeota archaeon]
MNRKNRIIVICLFCTPLIMSLVMFGIGELPIESPSQKNEFKFMTYNIHFGVGMDDLLNLERLAQNILIEDVDPDIIGLQEVENGRLTSQGIDMAYWLAQRLKMHYFYFPAVNEHAYGLALLSKYPIISATGYQIPSLSLERVLIHGVVMINETLELDIFVTHLGLLDWDEDLAAQVNFVLQKTNEVNKTTNRIIMGDFNLEYNSSQLAPLLSDFDDTLVEFMGLPRPLTFPSINLYGDAIESIDYIFASGYKNIINSHVITNFEPGNHPAEFGSDHLPVVATITFL